MRQTKAKTAQIRRWAASGVIALSAVCASAQTSSDALLNKLVNKGILTPQEAEELRKESDQPLTKTTEAKPAAPSATKKIALSGDLRLRVDQIWPERDLNSPDRLRFRLRLRYGGVWTPIDWATIGLRVSTGDARSSGGDANPNSNNQTFTHFFSKKPLFLDAAYVTLHPPEVDWVSITAGKMNKLIWEPGLNSPVVYDPDLTPEGAVEQFSYKFGDHHRFQAFANFGQFVLNELKSSSLDGYLFDAQAGITVNLFGNPQSPSVKATAAGGYLATMNLPHNPVADGSGNLGNAANGDNYLGDFDVAYARGEVAWRISSQPFLGTPAVLAVAGEFDKNLSSVYKSVTPDPAQTTAWTAQVAFGQPGKRGQWQVAYQYKYIEADAVLDSLTDDNFGAGTDREGHVIKTIYSIRDWWQFGATAYITQKISSRPNSDHNQVGFSGHDHVRLVIDTIFKF